MTRTIALLVAVAACGRVGFDPITGESGGDAATSSGSDARLGNGDGGGSATGADAQPLACANALPVQDNMKLTTSTCVGGDHLSGCGPPNTQEVVFEFVAPFTNGYSIEAFDSGTLNVSNSTTAVNASCTGVDPECSGILGLSMNQGDVMYFIVEAASGGCATIDFSITSN